MVLKNALTDVEIARFAVNQVSFQRATIGHYCDRQYPYGAELAHVLGYVSKDKTITTCKALDVRLAENYAADHNIGKQGIERYYENVFMAKPVIRSVEVDNHWRIVRLLKDVPPIAGKNIHLTLISFYKRVH